ncbi:MAG: DUF1189 family protein [Nitrospirae bacterium]|nr:DUF1189 family protein [Nitrospirota bacterium]
MKHYSIFHPLYMSFFSKSLYRDVAGNWKGLCFTYLLIVLALSIAPDMVRLHARVTDFIVEEAPKVVSQVPTITISEGQASIKEPVPYTINAPWSKQPFAVIDTSDRPPAMENIKATVILTKTKLAVRGDASDLRSLDLARLHNLVIDGNLISRWLEVFKDYFIFAVYIFALFFAFLYYLVQVMLCASIGMLFSRMFNLELSARALIRLSVIAFTPPILLQTAHAVLEVEFPFGSVITFVLATCYLYFAVGSCSEKTVSRTV